MQRIPEPCGETVLDYFQMRLFVYGELIMFHMESTDFNYEFRGATFLHKHLFILMRGCRINSEIHTAFLHFKTKSNSGKNYEISPNCCSLIKP